MTGARHMNRPSRLCAWLAALALLPSFSAALAQDYAVADGQAVRDIQPFIREMLANDVLAIESAGGE